MSFLIWTLLVLLNAAIRFYRRYRSYQTHEPHANLGANTLAEKLGIRAIRRRPSFMIFPPEIRLQIYEHLLLSPHTLRRPVELKTQPSFAILDTAILRTSRLVHDDALETLYTRNRFHISLVSPLRLPSSTFFFTAYLPSLTNLSIDYAIPPPTLHHHPHHPLSNHHHIDATIADELAHLADACQNLHVFALNLLSPPGEPDDVQIALSRANALTPPALRHLRVRDCIIITAVGSGAWLRSGDAYGPLRRAVAPLELWHTARCRRWPTTKTSVEGYEGDRRWARSWILLVPTRRRRRVEEGLWEKRGGEGG